MALFPFPFPPENSNATGGNRTMDVTTKNCLGDFNVLACLRSSVLTFLCTLTAVATLYRLIIVYKNGEQKHCKHRVALLFVILTHSVLGSLEWFIGWSTQSALLCSYMRSAELLIVCHFYMVLCARVLRWNAEASARITLLLVASMYIYFTAFVTMGMAYAQSPWNDCYAAYWIWLSGGHVIIAQALLWSAGVLVHRISRVSAEQRFKRKMLNDLYLLVGTFELAVILQIVYHIVLFIAADEEGGCSGVFLHRQEIYSPVKLSYQLLEYLSPMWASLWVFRKCNQAIMHGHTRGHSSTERLVRSGSLSGSGGVLLDPSNLPHGGDSRRRVLLLPGSTDWAAIEARHGDHRRRRWATGSSVLLGNGRRRRRHILRRSNSAPVLLTRSGLSVARGRFPYSLVLPASQPLDTIVEYDENNLTSSGASSR